MTCGCDTVELHVIDVGAIKWVGNSDLNIWSHFIPEFDGLAKKQIHVHDVALQAILVFVKLILQRGVLLFEIYLHTASRGSTPPRHWSNFPSSFSFPH